MSPIPHWQHNNDPQQGSQIHGHQSRHWQHGDEQPLAQHGWRHEWHRHRKPYLMFVRFLMSMFVIALLIGGAMALASHFFTNVGWGEGERAYPFFLWRFCGLIFLLPMLAWFILSRIYRSYGAPLAEIMDAAAEVAAGNLQVRVRERGSREFQQLASSFNHMTEELARIDQQRRNLTADVAHELRTPLHIIQGNLEGILDGVYAPTPEHIEATLQETRTLARLVDDLRTLSLAESGQLPLHPEVVDVHDLLADVATSFSPQAESAEIQLAVEADETTPMTVYGDPGRLDQVLSNLVNNALRHTPAGGAITLGAAYIQNGDQNGDGEQIQLTVRDTGTGIPAEDLPFIFDRFWRGDRARTHKEGAGSGLGLAITGQLVKAHGGTINVSSTPGNGTTFTVTLPANSPHHEVMPVNNPVDGTNPPVVNV